MFEIDDDAIVIKSPGLPVAPIKLEQLKKLNAPALSRNPMIMYVFDQLGLSEQRGYGFETVRTLPDKYKLPLPIITYEAPYVVFSFQRTRDGKSRISNFDLTSRSIANLSEEERTGWDYIRLRDSVSRKEYQERFSLTERTANRQLTSFVEAGLVEKVGKSTATKYKALA